MEHKQSEIQAKCQEIYDKKQQNPSVTYNTLFNEYGIIPATFYTWRNRRYGKAKESIPLQKEGFITIWISKEQFAEALKSNDCTITLKLNQFIMPFDKD